MKWMNIEEKDINWMKMDETGKLNEYMNVKEEMNEYGWEEWNEWMNMEEKDMNWINMEEKDMNWMNMEEKDMNWMNMNEKVECIAFRKWRVKDETFYKNFSQNLFLYLWVNIDAVLNRFSSCRVVNPRIYEIYNITQYIHIGDI